jgi:ribosomal protein L32
MRHTLVQPRHHRRSRKYYIVKIVIMTSSVFCHPSSSKKLSHRSNLDGCKYRERTQLIFPYRLEIHSSKIFLGFQCGLTYDHSLLLF